MKDYPPRRGAEKECITHGKISPALRDSESGNLPLDHREPSRYFGSAECRVQHGAASRAREPGSGTPFAHGNRHEGARALFSRSQYLSHAL